MAQPLCSLLIFGSIDFDLQLMKVIAIHHVFYEAIIDKE